MITIGLCLIYFGVALWGYQLYVWMADGEWISHTTMTAWSAYFGRPDLGWPIIGPVIEWFMNWPLSLTFIVSGCGVLCTVTGIRQHARVRLHRLRRKWITEHAGAAGYKPWIISRAVADFDKEVLKREAAGKPGRG